MPMIRRLSRRPEGRDTPGQGHSPARTVASANRWREQYNPLRGLVIATIVARLEEGERGQFQELMWLERFVEKRFPILRALITRRRAALLKLDWDIKTVSQLPAGATASQAEAQRAFLRSRYEAITNLKDAIRALALAEFRGFAILQKHRAAAAGRDTPVTELHWLPQWHFVRDGQFGDWYFDERGGGGTPQTLGEANRIGGPELPREEFLIREVDLPINEIALRAFQSWNLGTKDWAAFVEMYGLPGCVIEMPPNIPPGKEAEYEESAGRVAEGASGTVPNGAKPHFPTAQVRGTAPFKEFIEAQISDVVLAGTGGKLTMLNEATGIGGSQGQVHQDAFMDIAQSEAGEISEVFQRDFDTVELAAAFPGQPVLAYFELAAKTEEDRNAYVQRVVALNAAGYRTTPEEVSEKTGHELETETEPMPGQTDPAENERVANRAGAYHAQRTDNRQSPVGNQQFLEALAADLAPVRERLARILSIEDPDILKARLEAFLAELPRLLRSITADPESARILEQITAPALVAGLLDAKP